MKLFLSGFAPLFSSIADLSSKNKIFSKKNTYSSGRKSIDRAIQNYRRLGYSEAWINQRIKSIEVRKALTDEWDKSGVRQGEEYAALTDLMSRTWSGMTTREYKRHKGLKKENLRDNMTNTELVLNMLSEVAATDISIAQQPVGFAESAAAAQEGANVAKAAREQLEKSTGKPAVSNLNAKTMGQKQLGDGAGGRKIRRGQPPKKDTN
jgi:hypothetical protein